MIDKETILRLARESGLNDFGIAWQLDKLQAFSTAILAHRAESGVEVPEPQPVNESGSTMTITRWMVETPHGWVGAWDKGAITGLLLDYGNARAAEPP